MQTNIDYEISQLRDAVFGEDVRSAFISCMEKLHTVSETNANIVIEAERTMNEIRDNAVNALNNLTSKLETGEFIGPPGPQGLPGEKGDTGKTGNTGERGSKWMRGTAITGIDSNGVEFPNSDIENALAGDFFINTSTNDIYECVKSGNPSTAKWAYIGNIKGNKGDRGDVGPQGTVENIDDQILTFELAENLENVKSGETVKIAFGKLMKAVGAFIVHHTQKATTSILGHIKITNSAAVTDSTGLALAATEKNAAISGTLAHQIAQISAQNNDLTNSINQINSNLANKLKIVTILGINTYSTNVEYTPTNKANIFTYYIPILVWRQGAVVAKQGYDNTYDIVTADIPSVDSSICVIRHATFLINKTTGAIKIEKLNQANLQSDGNYIFSTDTMEIGLLGISL